MLNQEIFQIIEKNGNRLNGNEFQSLLEKIKFESNFLPENFVIFQRIYHLKNNLKEIPLCYCGGLRKWNPKKKIYSTCGSMECINNEIKNKFKEKYKNGHPMKENLIVQKMKQNNLKKYGVDNIMKLQEQRERSSRLKVGENSKIKMKKTRIEKYGKFMTNSMKEKTKKTNVEKYGVDHIMKLEKNIKNFKEHNPMKNEIFKLKQLKKLRDKLLIGLEEKFTLIEYGKILTLLDKRDGSIFKITKNTMQTRKSRKQEISILKNPIKKGYSIFEKEIYNYVRSLDNNLIVIPNYKDLIPPNEIDIYVPTKGIAIECNGDYWHANPKIFKENDLVCFSRKILKAKEIWERDELKKEKLNSVKVELITIWENDWKNNNKLVIDLLYSKILNK